MIEELFIDMSTDHELNRLLNLWKAPPVTASLDQRIAYIVLVFPGMNNPESLRIRPGLLEVSMKKCIACEEEFEDKFSFCPVDGTPLNCLAAALTGHSKHDERESTTRSTREERTFSHRLYATEQLEYRLTILSSAGLLTRLAVELRFCLYRFKSAWPNVRRDPIGFGKRGAVECANVLRERIGTSPVLVSGMTALFLVLSAVLFVVLQHNRGRENHLVTHNRDEAFAEILSLSPADKSPAPSGAGIGAASRGRVGFDRGSGEGSNLKPQRSHGGGSGGLRHQVAVQKGRIPPQSEIPAPIPSLPPARSLALPAAGIDIDPALWKALPFPVYGDPRSSSITPSNGPGDGGGMGTVNGQGIGDGRDDGFGSGSGGNIGDGPKELGSGQRGGGLGNNPNGPEPVFRASMVEQRARILSKPEPQYTEEARRNQITGTVVLRAVFSKTGDVTNIRAINSLPFGLTEKAIAAARQIRFLPATKASRPVSVHMQLEYNFNLY